MIVSIKYLRIPKVCNYANIISIEEIDEGKILKITDINKQEFYHNIVAICYPQILFQNNDYGRKD